MKRNKKLIIVGAGEFASIAYEYFTYDSDYEVVAFAVDREYINEEVLYSIPVIPFDEIETKFCPNEYEAFVAIPASKLNQTRTEFYKKMKAKGYKLASYISSQAFCWRNAEIGDNCFIFENNTIQPFVKIGNNVVLWSGNHVGHQSIIHDNVFVSSHVVISGYCEIGENCFLGVNSTFNDNTSIPKFSILASGSLVNRKLAEEERIYMGSPARSIPNKSALTVEL